MTTAAQNMLEKVSGEFESEVLADLQEGRGQALAALEAVKKETSREAQKIIEAGERQAESLKRQIIGAAELGVRNDQLKAVEAAVNNAFDDAASSISKATGKPMEEALTRLIEEGMGVLGGRAKVACSQKDRDAVSSVIKKLNKGSAKLTLEAKSLDSIGGVVLTTEDGTIRFDNTFEARVERMRPALRKEVAALLAGAR